MRFSLRWLFGITVYAAAGCALLTPSDGTSNALYDVAFIALCLISAIGSIYARDKRRAFWVGCAIVAWSFMLSGVLPHGPHTPQNAIRGILGQLSDGHSSGPLSNLRSASAEAFVAIGCSIAGGLLARSFISVSERRAS